MTYKSVLGAKADSYTYPTTGRVPTSIFGNYGLPIVRHSVGVG